MGFCAAQILDPREPQKGNADLGTAMEPINALIVEDKHMGWFRRKKCVPVSICIECRVHFEPRRNDSWAEYCFECRKPHKDRADRVELVKKWAVANYEKLEPQAKKWNAKAEAAEATRYADMCKAMQQAHASQQFVGGKLSGYGLGAFGNYYVRS